MEIADKAKVSVVEPLDTVDNSDSDSSDEDPQNNLEILHEMCQANGLFFHERVINTTLTKIPQLELFFLTVTNLNPISFFPNLRQLVIVELPVRRMHGIQALLLLEELWIAECELKAIEGLEECIYLKRLYLYSNQIKAIEGLHNCKLLEILWLSHNNIETINGLEHLINLKELNLSCNKITEIGNGLSKNVYLQTLNLSGNNIYSFREIMSLSSCQQLHYLSFADPQYMPCPITQICNYVTYALFNLRNLIELDGLEIKETELQEHLAQVDVKNKFYRMQLHCLEQETWMIQQKLYNVLKEIKSRLCEKIFKLAYTMKELEKIDRKQLNAKAASNISVNESYSVLWPNIEQKGYRDAGGSEFCKLATLNYKIKNLEKIIEKYESQYELSLKQVKQELDIKKDLLSIEYETLGSVRFTKATSSSPWYQACQDLMLSRFCCHRYNTIGINGIKLLGVYQINNKPLEMRFQDMLTKRLQQPDASGQLTEASFDYLFLIKTSYYSPKDAAFLYEIVEYGISKVQELQTCATPLLTNSLFRADKDKFCGTDKNLTEDKDVEFAFRRGWVVIFKAFTGQMEDLNESANEENEDFQWNIDVIYRKAVSFAKDESGSHIKTCICDLKCYEYYLLNADLIVPEYLINFEYIVEEPKVSPFLTVLQDSSPVSNTICLGGLDGINEDQRFEGELLSPKIRIVHPTWEDIVSHITVTDISRVNDLSLNCCSIVDLPMLSALQNLKKLLLAFNNLSNLRGISDLKCLEYLDVSFNRLLSLEGLQNVPSLTDLNVSYNLLKKDLDFANYLIKWAPSLRRLCIRQNLWPMDSDLSEYLPLALSRLEWLDDRFVKGSEDNNDLTFETASTLWHFTKFTSTHTVSPNHLSLERISKCLIDLRVMEQEEGKCEINTNFEHDRNWFLKITTIDMSHQHLRHLTGIRKLENLKWACLSHNRLIQIGELAACRKLEEILLRFNRISNLAGINCLKTLSYVDISHNHLEHLRWKLDSLDSLQVLLVNYNYITSLQGLEDCLSLKEFYGGYNRINSLTQLSPIKKIILNISVLFLQGNPVEHKNPDYRSYLLYAAPGLYALDGVLTNPDDVVAAKDMFEGRLTVEYIQDRLKVTDLSKLIHLDLPNCCIHDISLGTGEDLPQIESINLERNHLVEISNLLEIKSLKNLCLNYNRILYFVPPEEDELDEKSGEHRCCLPNLEVLHLGCNEIVHLENLNFNHMPALKVLFLHGNKITKISGLECLKNLEFLVLDRNLISMLDCLQLEALEKLKELHVQENRISEIPELNGPVSLRKFFIGYNRIKNLDELLKLSKLVNLNEVSFLGNPVNRRALERVLLIHFVPSLNIIDSREVTWEERAKAEQYIQINNNIPQLIPTISRDEPEYLPRIMFGDMIELKSPNSEMEVPDESFTRKVLRTQSDVVNICVTGKQAVSTSSISPGDRR